MAEEMENQAHMSVITQKRERRRLLATISLISAGLLFSFLSFVIMAANKHYNVFEEYRYSLAIAVIAFVYLALQLGKVIIDEVFGYKLLPETVVSYVDFIGDQLMAYLLMSSSSSAASLTNRLRDGGDDRFTDMAAGSVTMSFLAFAVMAASSLLSGYTICKQIAW